MATTREQRQKERATARGKRRADVAKASDVREDADEKEASESEQPQAEQSGKGDETSGRTGGSTGLRVGAVVAGVGAAIGAAILTGRLLGGRLQERAQQRENGGGRQDGEPEAGYEEDREAEYEGQPESDSEGATEKLEGVTGNGVPKKVWVPAAIAAVTAAAGYAAAKTAPKVRDAAVSKTEDAAQSVASEAEKRGGLAGTAAKLVRKNR